MVCEHRTHSRPVINSETLTHFLVAPDETLVRRFLWFLFAAGLAMADSHPSWWGFASPDATALVGIRWETLNGSAFAEPLQSEFTGSLGFPDLAILRDARQILISAPATIVMLAGNFPVGTLRDQAVAKALKPASYRGVAMWITPGKDTLSIAQVSEQLLLLGSRKTLEAAIDRNQAETGTSRRYSPLLARGARWANEDVWVVATRLPDPLANLFIPLEAEARGFDGGVLLGNGVKLEASLDAGSEDAAAGIADTLRQSLPGLPQVARGMKIVAEADHVLLTLDASRDALIADLRPQGPTVATAVAPPASTPAVEPSKPADPSPTPAGPQVIRIYGLDEGVREIVLPPAKPDKP